MENFTHKNLDQISWAYLILFLVYRSVTTYPGAWGIQDFSISHAGIILYNEFRYLHSLSLGGVPSVIKDGNTHIPNKFILQIGAQLPRL